MKCVCRSLAGLMAALGLGVAAAGCSQSPAGAAAMKLPPATVIVSRPVVQEVTDHVDYTGRTEAAETVEIRARVTGFLDAVQFEAGGEVSKGDPLYQIDPRQYDADLDAARAALSGALAEQDRATTDFDRVSELKKRGNVSQEEYDRFSAQKKEADARVQSAQAKVTRAELDVSFTKIAAPISGRISRTLVDQGNLVNADSTKLTTLVSVDPMFAYFDVDERTILSLAQRVREGSLKSPDEITVVILMGLATEEGYPHEGTMDFIDNRVDPNTGTIRVRGVFHNPRPDKGDRVLSPGLFARIRVPLGKPHEALLVNDRAVGTDQGQKFVYVVNDKNEVVARPVKLGAHHDGLRVIADGVQPADSIIIDGLQRVRPGSVVDPKPGDMRSRPGEAAKAAAQAAGAAEGPADAASAGPDKETE